MGISLGHLSYATSKMANFRKRENFFLVNDCSTIKKIKVNFFKRGLTFVDVWHKTLFLKILCHNRMAQHSPEKGILKSALLYATIGWLNIAVKVHLGIRWSFLQP